MSSTTGDSRLHHHMILRVHNEGTDAPTLLVIAHDFEGEKENRKQLFGKFFAKDIPKKFSIGQLVKVNTHGKLETRTLYCRQM